MAKRRLKSGDLLPWFLEDHATLPKWYVEECTKFFEWLKTQKGKYPNLEHQAKKKLH